MSNKSETAVIQTTVNAKQTTWTLLNYLQCVIQQNHVV